MYSLRMPTR